MTCQENKKASHCSAKMANLNKRNKKFKYVTYITDVCQVGRNVSRYYTVRDISSITWPGVCWQHWHCYRAASSPAHGTSTGDLRISPRSLHFLHPQTSSNLGICTGKHSQLTSQPVLLNIFVIQQTSTDLFKANHEWHGTL